MGRLTKSFTIRIFAAALSILIACPYSYAEGVGRVTYVEGRADVLKEGSEAALPLMEGDIISVGDAVRTKSNSKAEVEFQDRSVLRLAQNSKVDIQDYRLTKDNKRQTASIKLERGKVRTIIAKMHDAADFNINTPNASGTVKGSDVFAFYQAGNSGMLVAEGRLSVANAALPNERIVIPAGNSVLIPLEESPKGPRPYFDLEKKLNEEDTNVPLARAEKLNVIRGSIAKLSGDVRITKKGDTSSHAAKVNDAIGEGDKIGTGPDGMVEIKFDNGNALNLKPESNIFITRLSVNPSTGEYENLFESTSGKIKARIEGLKGKSRFEIRTPTAISGARGTIMYVEVTPTTTRVFFEGGPGYIANLISGLEKTVAMGQNSYTDNNGSVTDSTPTGEGDRMNWGEGWNPGSGTEGYSAPEGTVGVYLSESNTGTLTIVGTSKEPPVTEGPPLPGPDTRPGPTETGGTGTGTSGGTTEEEPPAVLNSSGILTGSASYYGAEIGESGGLVEAQVYNGPFWKEETAEFTSIGGFPVDDSSPFIWGGTDISYNPLNETFTTYDGAAYCGIAGGIGGETIINSAIAKILEGIGIFIYVDSDGDAGVATGNLFGIYGEGVYLLGGDITGTNMPAEKNIGVSAAQLYDSTWLAGTDDEGGTGNFITLSLINKTTHVAQNWGIFGGQGIGVFSSIPDTAASWFVGGSGIFGAYYNDKKHNFFDDEGYWVARITNESTVAGKITGGFTGRFLTHFKTGTLDGRGFATYRDSLEWQGIAGGVWDGESLAWSTDTYKNMRFHHYENGIIEKDGGSSLYGIIGSLMSPLASPGKPVDAVLMGEANTKDNRTWWGLLSGINYIGNNAVPEGYIGGSIDKNNIIDCILAAIYISSSGKAGVLLGDDFTGTYYPDMDKPVWEADGRITAIERGDNYDPTYYSVRPNYIDGYLNGNIGMEGSITNNKNLYEIAHGTLGSYTARLKYPPDGPMASWGVFNLELGGNYRNPDGSNSWTLALSGNSWLTKGNDYWFATVDGNKWSDKVISGKLKGVWFERDGDYVKAGIINGGVKGDYIEVEGPNGTFSAIGMGEWVEVTDLLDQKKMFGKDGLDVLNQYVNVPITEVYSSVMTGANPSVGITSITMDLSLYANLAALDHGILTLLIPHGEYNSSIGPGWSVKVDNVTLSNGTWDTIKNEWTADLGGILDGRNINGQAGGRFTNPAADGSGTFTGAGAGTWQQAAQPAPQPQ